MALIKCPECGKQISSQASSCPNCGCPIASRPTTVKIRCVSDIGKVKQFKFRRANGKDIIASTPVNSVATISISGPTDLKVCGWFGLTGEGTDTVFTAIPGKCYEARFCQPGLFYEKVVVTEVSFV